MGEHFSIINTTNGKLPRLPFFEMKEKVLGSQYDLSLVFVGEKKIRTLNRQYRSIDTPTDILSFSLSDRSGEIFICQAIAKKKAKEFERGYQNFLAFLFIHGLTHLLGFDHGTAMERTEQTYRRYFHI